MPFFEPLIIDVLIEYYPNQYVWTIIDCSFKIFELVIAGFVYLIWVQKALRQKKSVSKIGMLLILHLLLMIFSCILHMDFAITFFGSTFCTIALIPLSEYMIRKSKMDFLLAGKLLFSFWLIYGIITTFLFPNGFNVSSSKYSAIFGLGAKNNAFPFYFAYLFFLFAYKTKKNVRLPFYTPFVIAGIIVAALIYKSISTMFCIGLVLCIYLLDKNSNLLKKRKIAFFCFIVLTFVIVMIYIGLNTPTLEILLAKFGRNTTFSHRDVLWSQAISHFKRSPFWGIGASLRYQTVWANNITQHAHSQYLDKLAKFGIISFSFLAIALTKLFRKICQCDNLRQVNILAAMVLIYMLHMAFDTYNYNFFIIILITLNSFVVKTFQ